MTTPLDLMQTSIKIGQELMNNYWGPMYKLVIENPELLKVIPGFFMKPEEIIFYYGNNHLGIEYIGPEIIDSLPPPGGFQMKMTYIDLTTSENGLVNDIIGFDYSDGAFPVPLPPISFDWIFPTNSGFDKLQELGWNWAAQDSIFAFNAAGVKAIEGQFSRIINGRFFDADSSGLKTRHIKWLDLMPWIFDTSDPEYDQISMNFQPFKQLALRDARTPYPMPDDYKYIHLPRINRFIELLGNNDITEPTITSFLSQAEFRFILEMRFAASHIHSQTKCEWQSETKIPLIPDFFIVNTDGYADIVEFKLPRIKHNSVVGTQNRETFSSELNSYISQTRVYVDYFNDPNNRKWMEETYGIKVLNPKRYLIIGRRWDFSGEEWRKIAADYQGLNILTYDDLIDGVVVQFYKP